MKKRRSKPKITRPAPLKNPKPRPHRFYKTEEFAKMSKRERLEKQWHNDWMTVRALRKFVDGFDADSGFNLDDVYHGRLNSSMKAKIRRYRQKYVAETVAINSGHAVVRHYRDRKTLASAVEASQQFAPLSKDQRNAVFYTKYPEEFSVTIKTKRGEKHFELKDGVSSFQRTIFRSKEFRDELNAWYGRKRNWLKVLADEPDVIAEIIGILLPKARHFAVLTGKYAMAPIKRDDFLGGWFANWIMQYQDDDGDFMADIENFLIGVQAVY